MCTVVAASVNCTFTNSFCDYSTMNTSASFSLSYEETNSGMFFITVSLILLLQLKGIRVAGRMKEVLLMTFQAFHKTEVTERKSNKLTTSEYINYRMFNAYCDFSKVILRCLSTFVHDYKNHVCDNTM